MPRAVQCFKKVNVDVSAFPAHYLQENYELWIDKFFPSEQALVAFYYLWHEIVGFTVYKLIGYI
jgi:uncharacterized SAM-binding protein YcdF (DUF218 family)